MKGGGGGGEEGFFHILSWFDSPFLELLRVINDDGHLELPALLLAV